jgi:hypothetical protein
MMNCDQFVIGFIESVRKIAQRGDTTPALSRVEEALRQIQQDTTNGFKQIRKDTEDIRQDVLRFITWLQPVSCDLCRQSLTRRGKIATDIGRITYVS